jgi:probable rRNA maturation factor
MEGKYVLPLLLMNNIEFHFEDIVVPDFNSEFFRLWINVIIKQHNKNIGDLNYIFCSDDYILGINKEHLSHDYFTDIITFNYNEDIVISGDVFISYDSVKSNALVYSNGNIQDELDRVIIHGVLHLIGFNDKTELDQIEMTKQEDIALKLRDNVSRETKQG